MSVHRGRPDRVQTDAMRRSSRCRRAPNPRRWKDLIDFDVGRIATGEATIEEPGWDLTLLTPGPVT